MGRPFHCDDTILRQLRAGLSLAARPQARPDRGRRPGDSMRARALGHAAPQARGGRRHADRALWPHPGLLPAGPHDAAPHRPPLAPHDPARRLVGRSARPALQPPRSAPLRHQPRKDVAGRSPLRRGDRHRVESRSGGARSRQRHLPAPGAAGIFAHRRLRRGRAGHDPPAAGADRAETRIEIVG